MVAGGWGECEGEGGSGTAARGARLGLGCYGFRRGGKKVNRRPSEHSSEPLRLSCWIDFPSNRPFLQFLCLPRGGHSFPDPPVQMAAKRVLRRTVVHLNISLFSPLCFSFSLSPSLPFPPFPVFYS